MHSAGGDEIDVWRMRHSQSWVQRSYTRGGKISNTNKGLSTGISMYNDGEEILGTNPQDGNTEPQDY